MAEKHPDTIALDRLGTARLRSHFNITRQSIAYWRANGVPKMYRKSIADLGAKNGIQTPGFEGSA